MFIVVLTVIKLAPISNYLQIVEVLNIFSNVIVFFFFLMHNIILYL